MKHKFVFVIVIVIGILAGRSFGQSSDYIEIFDTDQISQQTDKIATNIETINSAFIQEKNITFLYERIISKGII